MSGRHLVGTLGSSKVELARLAPKGPLVPTGAVVVGATIWTSLESGESTYQHFGFVILQESSLVRYEYITDKVLLLVFPDLKSPPSKPEI